MSANTNLPKPVPPCREADHRDKCEVDKIHLGYKSVSGDPLACTGDPRGHDTFTCAGCHVHRNKPSTTKLTDMLEAGPLTAKKIEKLAGQVCKSCLDFAASRKWIHDLGDGFVRLTR